jgi:hypothetical protein
MSRYYDHQLPIDLMKCLFKPGHLPGDRTGLLVGLHAGLPGSALVVRDLGPFLSAGAVRLASRSNGSRFHAERSRPQAKTSARPRRVHLSLPDGKDRPLFVVWALRRLQTRRRRVRIDSE